MAYIDRMADYIEDERRSLNDDFFTDDHRSSAQRDYGEIDSHDERVFRDMLRHELAVAMDECGDERQLVFMGEHITAPMRFHPSLPMDIYGMDQRHADALLHEILLHDDNNNNINAGLEKDLIVDGTIRVSPALAAYAPLSDDVPDQQRVLKWAEGVNFAHALGSCPQSVAYLFAYGKSFKLPFGAGGDVFLPVLTSGRTVAFSQLRRALPPGASNPDDKCQCRQLLRQLLMEGYIYDPHMVLEPSIEEEEERNGSHEIDLDTELPARRPQS